MVSNHNNKKFIPLSEVKNILKKVEKERKELTYEQRIALEHANKFAKLQSQKTKDLINDYCLIFSVDPVAFNKVCNAS